MKNTNQLIEKIAELYLWIEEQIQNPKLKIKNSCTACGNCCDFETYGHRLYITPPELMYLAAKIGKENITPMTASRCPYQIDNRCSIHEFRFASCRIFFCRGDNTLQSDLSEETLKKLKALCIEFDIPYRYIDLRAF
ncbi:MAG: YkgJ family cysteine cluster protein [Sedimentisphaerales bacterium]|nr:YkgJ family cysteine cluster protein [Sedimentisphaerales bacterium]